MLLQLGYFLPARTSTTFAAFQAWSGSWSPPPSSARFLRASRSLSWWRPYLQLLLHGDEILSSLQLAHDQFQDGLDSRADGRVAGFLALFAVFQDALIDLFEKFVSHQGEDLYRWHLYLVEQLCQFNVEFSCFLFGAVNFILSLINHEFIRS